MNRLLLPARQGAPFFHARPRAAHAALLAALALAAAVPVAAIAQDETPPPAGEADIESETEAEAKELTKGEARLAKLLEGRVAGEPQTCIRNLPTGRSETIDRTAYVFGSGNTIYVQRTTRPEQINDRDTLVLRRFGASAQLCRQDIATTIDPVTRIFTGAVFFEDFIPYTRVKDDSEG